jgi:hypothetical protein
MALGSANITRKTEPKKNAEAKEKAAEVSYALGADDLRRLYDVDIPLVTAVSGGVDGDEHGEPSA